MKISEVVNLARRVIIGLEGKVTRSEFYLTGDDEKLEFCMTPEDVKVKSTASFRTYNVIELGEIKIPKGEQLTAISWRGTLPGAAMLMHRFIKTDAWQKPDEVIKTLQKWRTSGTKLKLLVTQTPINLDVYIKSFDSTFKGALGNVEYTLDLIAAKPLQVRTVAEVDAANASNLENSFELLERSKSKIKTGVLLATVNSIYEASQILTGDGGNWQNVLLRNGIENLDEIDPMIVLH